MTYFCPSWKRPSPCFQYAPTTVVVLIRQPSQNIHTFCQRFRSPYVFWSSSSLLVDETAEVVLPPATSTEFDSNWVYSSLYLLSTVLLYTTYCLKKNNAVVHQPVLVEYYYSCCFHLNYGATTVDHDIIIRKKKRSLLCAPHPHNQASLKFVKVWQPTNRKKHQSRACVQFCEHSVQNFIRVAYSCRASVFSQGCVCVHPPTMGERRQNLHIRWCLGAPTCKNKIFRSSLSSPAFGNLNFVSPPHRRA